MNAATPAAAPLLRIVDTTLRDGLQAPDVTLDNTQVAGLARELAAAGVELLECAVAAAGGASDTIAAATGAAGASRIMTWCRALERDLDTAAGTAAGHVHISFPVSPIHLAAWRRDTAWVLHALARLVPAARQRFATVGVGAQDASRADPVFLAEFAAAARELGADRLRAADTAGVWTPAHAAAAIAALRDNAPPLEIHAHNDLGLATAVTLAAADSGAAWADTTVNGLGERAGNAPLAEVVAAWRLACGGTTGVNPAALPALSALLARMSGRAVPPDKPLVGSAVFTHASGIHCAGALRDRRAYEGVPPALVGREPEALEIGWNAGVTVVADALLRHGAVGAGGAKEARALAAAILPEVRRLARERRRPLAPAEVAALAAAVQRAAGAPPVPRRFDTRRALGAFLGLATGDALGGPVEFMLPHEIRAAHKGRLTEMTGGGWLRLKPGQVTDDTQMALAVGGALVAAGGWDLRGVAESFVAWLRSRPIDVGNACRRGIRRYMQDGSLAAPESGEDGGNGALMRQLPVALGTPPDATGSDDAEFARRAVAQARITHGHVFSDEANVALGRMTRLLLSGGTRADCRAVADALVARFPAFKFSPWPGRTSGYVVDTMQTVLDVFFAANSFEECVVEAVNRGGDADTIGALTGQLAGAFWGADAIPERWLRRLDPAVRVQIETQTNALLALT